ncbi:MAG: hypothetical protein IPH97_06355 [Ignavibacteriales bacterium]|nr:hypothetical protein [Ignavibacteriales bacterium]
MAEEKYKHTIHFKRSDLEYKKFVIWSPSQIEWRDIIEDYIYISKVRSKNKLAMFKLQIELISTLLQLNDGLKTYIKLVEDPEERKKEFPDREIEERDIDYWEKQIFNHKTLINAIKDIGDGIAWRLFGFDRELIYNICINNDDPGPLTLNQGFITELYTLGDYMNEPEIVNMVYHGITNFLLISDITLLYQNEEINFIEVKSKKTGRGQSWRERIERQKLRVENIVKIGNEGEGFAVDVPIKFMYIDKKPETILNKLETLLKRSLTKDAVTELYNSYLGIGIVNLSLLADDLWKQKFDKVKKQITREEKDFVMLFGSIDWEMFSPNKAPLSIHPFSPEIVANLLLGKQKIFYFFNLDQFYREFEKRGWKVIKTIDKTTAEKNTEFMFLIKKEKLTLSIPPALFSRAIYEGLSVDSILTYAEDVIKTGQKDEGFGLFIDSLKKNICGFRADQ